MTWLDKLNLMEASTAPMAVKSSDEENKLMAKIALSEAKIWYRRTHSFYVGEPILQEMIYRIKFLANLAGQEAEL